MSDDERGPMNTSGRLWAAVHSITEPTREKIERSSQTDRVAELDDVLALIDSPDGQGGVCHVPDYWHAVEWRRLATVAYGHLPPLWSQATWAVFGSEAGDGSGGRTSARERTPADLDLMETLLTIRESLGWQLPGRGVAWRKPGVIPDMMLQLANHITRSEPQHVEWWAFRFEQWARLLQNGLNALDRGPKPVYLRNSACPLCRTRQVTIDRAGDAVVVPAIVVQFAGQFIRAAQCQACAYTWWRGDELGDLANALDPVADAG